MRYNLAFTIPYYTDDDSTFSKPVNGNYDYWPPLITYFLAKSDTIEIQCWNEEIEAIEELKKLHINTLEICKKEAITVFKGKKTAILSDYLLNSSINSMGEFTWFTVNLEHGEVPVFHSGHWGMEFFVPNATEMDRTLIQQVTPDNTSFHQ